MKKKTPLEYGKFFHIYNRGVNSCTIFNGSETFIHFFKLLSIYIEPIADTYSWVLMSNHFHLLVRIKNEDEIGYLNPAHATSSNLALKWKTDFIQTSTTDLKKRKKPIPERMFGHLFDAYAKWYNSKFDRTGELFESTFERKWINSDKYLKTMVEYIHYNPVHHHICNKIADYKWTSYQTILSDKLTKLKRNEVIEWFGDSANFIFVINKTDKFDDIEHLIIE